MTVDELFAAVPSSPLRRDLLGRRCHPCARIRKRIGKSANLKPRTPKEKFLWLGWTFMILAGSCNVVHLRASLPIAFINSTHSRRRPCADNLGYAARSGATPRWRHLAHRRESE